MGYSVRPYLTEKNVYRQTKWPHALNTQGVGRNEGGTKKDGRGTDCGGSSLLRLWCSQTGSR